MYYEMTFPLIAKKYHLWMPFSVKFITIFEGLANLISPKNQDRFILAKRKKKDISEMKKMLINISNYFVTG